MKDNIYAVITGDLVASTAISVNYEQVLNQIADDIKECQEEEFIFEIFRGDSFQGLVIHPERALLISILFRAGLRRNTKGRGIEDAWDARIAIGIGAVKDFNHSNETKLGPLSGEAFLRSGRALDKMKSEESLLKIVTGDQYLDDEFAAICPLVDTLVGRWSTAQAEAVYLYLLKDLIQQEIGERLNISQRAISKRIDSSNVESMQLFFERYKRIITWKYSN